MKKLNLQLGSIKEMLSKEQMKKIVGGYSVGCECFLEDGTMYGSTTVECDVTQECVDECADYCDSVHP